MSPDDVPGADLIRGFSAGGGTGGGAFDLAAAGGSGGAGARDGDAAGAGGGDAGAAVDADAGAAVDAVGFVESAGGGFDGFLNASGGGGFDLSPASPPRGDGDDDTGRLDGAAGGTGVGRTSIVSRGFVLFGNTDESPLLAEPGREETAGRDDAGAGAEGEGGGATGGGGAGVGRGSDGDVTDVVGTVASSFSSSSGSADSPMR